MSLFRPVGLDGLEPDVPPTLQVEVETLHGSLYAALSPQQAWSLAEHLRDAAIAKEAA